MTEKQVKTEEELNIEKLIEEQQPKIERYIERYYELDQAEKVAKKTKDPLKADIKNFMALAKKESISVGDITASFNTQLRTSLNEDELLKKIKGLIKKDKSLKNLVVKKETPNVQMIEDMIYNGQLDVDFLKSCVEVKPVEVLSVSKSKKKKDKKEQE